MALAGRGGPWLPVGDLARRLLRLTAPVDERVARRLVAAAAGVPHEHVPAEVGPEAVRAWVHGPQAELPLGRAGFVVVDLETTGLSLERAQILEIGAVRVVGLRRVESFHSLCDPGGPIPGRITRLTGIDARTVEGAPPLHQALTRFRAWLERAPGEAFVAHNASFDARFIARGLADVGLPPLRAPVLCTRKLARRLLPELGRYGLDALCAHLGIANGARHRALGDAEATARALIELLQRAREEQGVRTLAELLELQDASLGRRRRGRGAARGSSKVRDADAGGAPVATGHGGRP